LILSVDAIGRQLGLITNVLTVAELFHTMHCPYRALLRKLRRVNSTVSRYGGQNESPNWQLGLLDKYR